ncbi:MAG: hypothetical protein ACRDQZ_22700, partial [Mycobacteriales bacterium]
MRPLLSPALPQLWRDKQTLQLGIDPQRAVILHGRYSGFSHIISALDGRHTVGELAAIAGRHSISDEQLSALLTRLTEANLLLNGSHAQLPVQLPSAARRRVQPDLSALSLTHHARANHVFGNRFGSTVVIYGEGRAAPIIGALLAASGVGRVHVYGSGRVTTADVCVGGILPSDEGRPYVTAAHEAITRSAPEVDTRPPHPSKAPNFIVLARGPICGAPQLTRHAHHGVPHLPVLLRDGTVIVGPLVIPGRTTCLNCLDLHRGDRDPEWPVLASQLATYP